MGPKASNPETPMMINHQKLGAVRIFDFKEQNQNGENEDVPKMEITRNVIEKKNYEQWVNSLKKINDSQGKELFLVPESHQFEKAGLCGSHGIVKIVYPKFQFVLSSEIKNRNHLSKFFEETQIWYVLYNLVRAGNKFEVLKQKVGDIHPNNILINEDGQTSIISQLSLPEQSDNFQRYIEDKHAEVFLGRFILYPAPEQMKRQDIEKSLYNQKIDKCLAEVFSIGLTVLSAGTLEHCNDVYFRDPFSINYPRLDALFGQFTQRYSPYLSQTLKSMLQLFPEKRVRSKKLYDTLCKYQNQILELESFQAPSSNQSPSSNGFYPKYHLKPDPQIPQQTYQQYGMPYHVTTGPLPVNTQFVPNVRWNDSNAHYKRI